MTQSLNRKKRTDDTENPFLKEKKKEKKESDVTMKVPVPTHKKVKALAKLEDEKIYEMIDVLAEAYIGHLNKEKKGIYDFLISKE